MTTWYGNLNNRLWERSRQPTPEVGMGATILMYTDRRAGTVVEVKTVGKNLLIKVKEDRAIRTDKNGLSEVQSYRFEPNANGPEYLFKQFGGRWREVQVNPKTGRLVLVDGGAGLGLGHRDAYHDFSF